MGSDLRRLTVNGSAVHTAEFIVSSARLAELHECSALLRRTRMRAEEIVDEARALLAEAEQYGDGDRVLALRTQVGQARQAYTKVLTAYVTILRRINEERQAILRAHMEQDRHRGLSGAA
ncbi:MAG TPA: hypothetical protein VFV66_06225 [Nonomuraea sp.]|nr:hypothetical protein [Nonomuraea sp.]